jgi:hypothetical protein
MAAIVSSPTVALLRAPLASRTARKAPAGGISQLRSAARPLRRRQVRAIPFKPPGMTRTPRSRVHIALSRPAPPIPRVVALLASPSSPDVSYPILHPAMLRASAPVDSVVSGVNQAIPQVADVFGVDTSAADTVFVNAASIILPAWGAIVGAIFVFGTIYKIAFPDKYNEQVYSGKAAEMVQDEMIDLDNLSEEDLAAVAELEAERAAQK